MGNQISKKRMKGMSQFGYNSGKSKAAKQKEEANKEEAAKGNFDFDVINGFKLVDAVYKSPKGNVREERRENFVKEVRPAFLKFIAENFSDDLSKLGISDSCMKYMKEGTCPNGFNVHHKLPIHGGGSNDFKNLIFIPIEPHDELHHDVLNPQIENKKTNGDGITVKLPWSDDMVWKRPARSREKTQDKTVSAAVMDAVLKQKAGRC